MEKRPLPAVTCAIPPDILMFCDIVYLYIAIYQYKLCSKKIFLGYFALAACYQSRRLQASALVNICQGNNWKMAPIRSHLFVHLLTSDWCQHSEIYAEWDISYKQFRKLSDISNQTGKPPFPKLFESVDIPVCMHWARNEGAKGEMVELSSRSHSFQRQPPPLLCLLSSPGKCSSSTHS